MCINDRIRNCGNYITPEIDKPIVVTMNDHLEASFKQLSEGYLSKISEERKKADENQLAAINSSLREWAGRIQQSGTPSADHSIGNEHELIRDALLEAKDRQGKIIDVLFSCSL